jgi:hypothetical protein
MIAGRTCATALLAAPAWLLRSGSTSAQRTEIPPVAQSEAEQIATDASRAHGTIT